MFRPKNTAQPAADRPAPVLAITALIAALVLIVWHDVRHPGVSHLVTASVLFVTALFAARFSASYPQGQQISLLPPLGMASWLLLTPCDAPLPLLFAGALTSLLRPTSEARRVSLWRTLWLCGATLAAGLLHDALRRAPLDFAAIFPAALLYAGIDLGGRAVTARSAAARPRLLLEGLSLLMGSPAAILLADAVFGHDLPAAASATFLLVFLIVISYLAFEMVSLRDQVRAMEKMSSVMLTEIDLARLTERFLALSGQLVGAERATLWLADPDGLTLRRSAVRPPAMPQTAEAATIKYGEGLVGRTAERQLPLIVLDSQRDPRTAAAEDGEGVSLTRLFVPLVIAGRVIGVAQYERSAARPFTRRDTGRLRSLASQSAALLVNAQAHWNVYEQSMTDGLTGVANRRHIQEALEEEFRRAKRYGRPMGVCLVDVDSFKSYNDTYGHMQGDVLLKMIARIPHDSVRKVDLVGRWGGEEFLILMPETDRAAARLLAERLRAAIAGTAFPGFPDAPGQPVRKTASLGVAAFPEDSDDLSALITLADEALYRAKRGGRNQVVAAGD